MPKTVNSYRLGGRFICKDPLQRHKKQTIADRKVSADLVSKYPILLANGDLEICRRCEVSLKSGASSANIVAEPSFEFTSARSNLVLCVCVCVWFFLVTTTVSHHVASMSHGKK